MPNQTFARRVKEGRKKLGLTQTEIGKLLTVYDAKTGTEKPLHHVTIVGYENGSREPKMGTIVKYAELFGVSVDYLLGLTDDPDPLADVRSMDRMFERFDFVEYEGAAIPTAQLAPIKQMLHFIAEATGRQNDKQPQTV